MIDSCRVVSQSNYLNNHIKDYDWLPLACFIREQCTANAIFTPLKSKVWFEYVFSKCAGKLLIINIRLRLVFSRTPLSCSNTSCVLNNRTEHRRGSLFVKYDNFIRAGWVVTCGRVYFIIRFVIKMHEHCRKN